MIERMTGHASSGSEIAGLALGGDLGTGDMGSDANGDEEEWMGRGKRDGWVGCDVRWPLSVGASAEAEVEVEVRMEVEAIIGYT